MLQLSVAAIALASAKLSLGSVIVVCIRTFFLLYSRDLILADIAATVTDIAQQVRPARLSLSHSVALTLRRPDPANRESSSYIWD
jgi:hypothetical protein